MIKTSEDRALETPRRSSPRVVKGLASTIPIVLAGTMAMSANITGPLTRADEDRAPKDESSPSELGKSIREALAAAHAASLAEATGDASATEAHVVTTAVPQTYAVAAGDTVSSIAGRYGLATASVLALNGLGWKSVIFPGQVLTLSSAPTAPVVSTPAPGSGTTQYTIVSGDTVSKIASKVGVSTQSILAANGLSATSTIYAGRTLGIPNGSAPAATSGAPIAAPAPQSVANTAHVIKSGETIADIARQYGVSIQAVLDANGLGWSSIIYSGRTLVIPGVAVATPAAPGVTALTADMANNARTIISVGKSLGVSDYGLVIALSAAMQESSLLNLNYGDRDSLGLFQQRPSTGWGTPAQVTDPVHASKLFFGGPSGPNRGVTNGLLDIPGWNAMTVTQAAQAVQRSAYPDAYAKWEVSAWAWLTQLG